jgi:hypothetical protein
VPRRRSPSSLILVLLPALFVSVGCEETVPSQLRPLFDTVLLPGLPDPQCGEPVLDCCFEEGTCEDVSFTVRNLGSAPVRVSGVSFEAVDGLEGDLDAFSDLVIDTPQIVQDDVAVIQFRYLTPGGLGRAAVIVVESDAEENPRLEVPVEATDFVPEPVDDAGVPEDAGNPVEDAGSPVEDAGSGDPDAGDAG